MYNGLRARPGLKRAAGTHTRQMPTDAHVGTYRDFLCRHESEASAAASGTLQERQDFAECLPDRIADTRNLMAAIEHLTMDGPKAPGPNGIRLEHLDQNERWLLCRALSPQLKDGNYQPGPTTTRHAPKASGTGTRPIQIHNAEDQVVQRAIVQAIQPYLDPRFANFSVGYRPGMGINQAIRLVEQLLMADQTRWTWVTEDIRDAFMNVPHARLIDVLRWHLLPENVVGLIGTIIGSDRTRGLPQGGSLSALLLNIYLDRFLDKPWQRRQTAPLVRVADDLLTLASSREEAEGTHDALTRLLHPTGLSLKGTKQTVIRDLACGQRAMWLGLEFGKEADQLTIRVHQRRLNSLRRALEEAHQGPKAQQRAYEIMQGWTSQLGPCYPWTDRGRIYSWMGEMADELGFGEIPSQEEVEVTWNRAWTRYMSGGSSVSVSVGTVSPTAPPSGIENGAN